MIKDFAEIVVDVKGFVHKRLCAYFQEPSPLTPRDATIAGNVSFIVWEGLSSKALVKSEIVFFDSSVERLK
jgi:predicted Holliday junction resolvase-like endonuclease